MEEKINNQKIFFYVPPIVAKLIIDSDLKDSDLFFNDSNNNIDNINLNSNIKQSPDKTSHKKSKSKKFNSRTTFRHDSQFIKPNVFPISNILSHSLVMCIRLKGFEKLIYSLIIDDKENKKEKLFSEYLSITISRLILKISGILSENGGEIIKYNDYEILVLWNFSNSPLNKILKYKKFYSKYALISAMEIMKKFDDSEILGTKIEISIGMGLGESDIVFFGGERKRSEYVVLGDAIEQAQMCVENSLEHEIIISKEINNLFKSGQELITRELKNEYEQTSYFAVDELFEDSIKNFDPYKGMKLNNGNIYMNKSIYENLSKKVYILSSILPQGLIKYLDVGNEENLKELNNLTIETIQISISLDLIDDINLFQNLIFDIQKATYMTFGSLLYIIKTYKGFLIRCCWGIDPGNFIDNTSRAISTAILIGNLTNYYNVKIGIGITTGACFSGLINVQSNRNLFNLMGKKVNLSRKLADEALSSVIKSELKYLIYCDKLTMKLSQKTYRQTFVSKIKIYFDKELDLVLQFRDDFFTGIKNNLIKQEKKERKNMGNFKKRRLTRREIVKNSKSIDIKDLSINNKTNEKYETGIKQSKLIQEIFSPIENDEFFLPNINDPFPLIRTHLYNPFNSMNKILNFNIMNSNKQIKNFLLNNTIKEELMTENTKKKLKKSQTIFGYSQEIEKITNIMNNVIIQNKKQFIAVKGPLGVGKSLFMRKALNNFIGLNEKLNKIYFGDKEFLFCSLINPFIETLPYNTIAFILRKIYFYILKYNLINALFLCSKKLLLIKEDLENFSYILSIGKKDINVKQDFDMVNIKNSLKNKLNEKEEEKKNEDISLFKNNNSVIEELGRSFNYNNIDKLNMFFYEMIRIYKEFLQNSFPINDNNKNNFICPIIFVIEDAQKSNDFAFEFIQFLFSKDDSLLNPFILILVEQTPIYFEHNSFGTNKKLELFISTFSEYTPTINPDKIIAIDIKPISNKKEIEKLLVFYFKDLVMKNFKTNLEKVDDQILDFLLHKSFNGIPLFVISLFKSLIKSEKFIQTLSAEFIITSELIDDNKMLDWSDILLPYEYDKICSMKINSILNFKETLIFKYACILGTIFDLQTLDKLNPLYSIFKMKDLIKVIEKLEKEHIIEIFSGLNASGKKENVFCKISFPFMREVFQQKFPIEYRKTLHMKAAKIISTDKKINYFSTETNILILKRHLLFSEMDVVNEIEIKNAKSIKNISKNRQELNYNNLKILLVKELYSRFCYPISNQVLEGNLELYYKSKWLRISYYIERKGKIYFNQKDFKKGTLRNVLIFSIEDIYKNHILKRVDENKFKCLNVLEISVSTTSKPLTEKNKKIYYFRSEQREELSKLDIAINFLRVKVNYEKFVGCYGLVRFPLYRFKWFFKSKVNIYYANLEMKNINKKSTNQNNYNLDSTLSDKILDETNDYYKSFSVIFKTTLSIFLGTIQENIINKRKKDNKKSEQNNSLLFSKGKVTYNILKYFTIPEHISNRINKYLKILEKKGIISNKPEEYSLDEKLFDKLITKLENNESNKNNSKKLKNKSQPKVDKKETKKNSSKSSHKNKKKRKNRSVDDDNKLKAKPKNNNNNNEEFLLQKKDNDFNSEKEITFSDFNSEKSDSDKNSKSPHISDENSFNSILNELSKNKKVQINQEIQNNININKSRNPKSTKENMVKIILKDKDQISFPGDFVPMTERSNYRSHVQYIDDTCSTKYTKKQAFSTIFNYEINSLNPISYAEKYKKEMKFKTLSDDPKYSYVESNKMNKSQKTHKSNFFGNLKQKSKYK